MARTEDRFLVRESKDTTVAGEVWAVKTGETIYGIAGADGNAEKERKAAEDARKAAETARASAESARASAESARADAEQKRAQAESARASEETKRTQAEESRKSEESKRAAAESKRVEAETARASEESKRAQAESKRAEAETARSTAEQGRASKEAERVSAEAARVEAEKARVSAEQSRSTAESARAAADEKRQTDQAKNNADQALNNEQMKKLSPVILQEGQYDRDTLKPTIEGEPNRMYFVPMVAPAAIELYDLTPKQVEAGNLYVEWMWVGGKWEQMGQSEMKVKPVSTDQIDSVFAGAHPTGDGVLNLTGVDYFKTKADAEYAASTYMGVIESGDLNQVIAPGTYKLNNGGSISNFPSGAYQGGVLEVAMADNEGQTGTQTYYAHQGGGNAGPFVRVRHGGSWRDWQRAEISGHKHGAGDITGGTLHVDRVPELPIAKVSGLQGALDGKQPKGSYAASSHTHAISNVSGLQGALDGKQPKGSYANASHRHNTGDINNLDSQLNGIRDSVSRVKVFCGHGVAMTDASGRSRIKSFSELTSMAGFSCRQENCCLFANTADWSAYSGLVSGYSDTGGIGISTNKPSGAVRITWVIIAVRR